MFRIHSIDALRGLDMLLLCGGAGVLSWLFVWQGGEAVPGWVMQQFRHAEWGGTFTCWDLVMPLFIFITGASMPFAFAKYRQKGGEYWRLGTAWRVLRRVVLLFMLGMLVQGRLACAQPEHMSLFCNTLQAIAEGYLIAAVVLMCSSRLRVQMSVCLCCMVSYWALLRFVPYDGQPGGLFEAQNNLAIYIDRTLQGHWQDGTPYSWILTSLSFGALTLMGSMCGQTIAVHRGWRAVLTLLLVGLLCLGAALLLEADTPLIKHIYTTTCVLWAGGWCVLLLALFHLLFDCGGEVMVRLAYPLQVVGCNALLAYLLTEVHGPNGHSVWWGVVHPLIYGLAGMAAPGAAASFVHALLSLLLLWGLLWFLYRRRVFLRV
ncbi:MAG: DUF5009 domain-containing protein [Akkermansia sp.]|nr:DUF5009 domain-containing protein [Akkermansia sp.]